MALDDRKGVWKSGKGKGRRVVQGEDNGEELHAAVNRMGPALRGWRRLLHRGCAGELRGCAPRCARRVSHIYLLFAALQSWQFQEMNFVKHNLSLRNKRKKIQTFHKFPNQSKLILCD